MNLAENRSERSHAHGRRQTTHQDAVKSERFPRRCFVPGRVATKSVRGLASLLRRWPRGCPQQGASKGVDYQATLGVEPPILGRGVREALKRSDEAPRGLIPGLQLVIGAGAGHPAEAAETPMPPPVLPLCGREGGRRVLRQHSSLFVTVEPRDAVAPCRVTGALQ